MKPISGLRIGTKISLGVSFVLVGLLLISAATLIYDKKQELENETATNSRQLLTTIRILHVESMLNRIPQKDGDPAVKVLNHFVANLEKTTGNTKIWLVQGPKVLAYQKTRGQYEEPPLDDIDRQAFKTGKPIEKWGGKEFFRITSPVIMGEGVANDPRCATCHTNGMGIGPGEPLGAYSIKVDMTDRWAAFDRSAQTILFAALAISLLISALTAFLLHQTAGRPLAIMTKIMNRLASGDLKTEIPALRRADEIGDMARALSVFKETAQRRKTAETSLSHSEERMQTVLMNLLDGVIIIDENGTIEFFNPAAEEIFGFTANEIKGTNIRYLMPEPYSSGHDQYLKNYCTTGTARIIGMGREVVGLRKDDSTFPMELAVSESTMNGKRRFTGMVRDITERKRIEEALFLAKNDAEAANMSKSEFLANMSHELRTPLNAIIGFSEATLSGVFGQIQPTEYEEYLVNIRDSGHHLLNIISQILDISQIEKGNLEVSPEDFDLHTLTKETAKVAAPMIAKEGNTFSLDCPTGITVYLDPVRMRQIILNLLSNAAKFTQEGTIEMIVREEDRKGVPYVVVTVSDSGIGIAPEQVEAVFEPFEQGDQSVRKKYGGTGLGLAISRELARLMGGDLNAESTKGKGSVFTLALPQKTPTLEM